MDKDHTKNILKIDEEISAISRNKLLFNNQVLQYELESSQEDIPDVDFEDKNVPRASLYNIGQNTSVS